MAANVTYEVNVTPRFEGLAPKFDATIYRTVKGGVSGTFTWANGFDSVESVDAWALSYGFARTEDFGPVCANGFATAPLGRA